MHSAASTLALSASSPSNNIHHQYLTCLAEAKNTNLVNEAKNELLAQDLGYGESDLETATTSASELEFIDLDRPPARPGTIADREHRKWTENAISLLNNPYSKENIERRLTRGSRDSLHLSSPTDFVRSVNSSHNDLMMTLNAPRKIDCGLRSINSARYRRDYYINGDMDEIPRFKKLSSSSDTKELPSPPPFRTVTSTSHPKDSKQEVKRKGHSDPGPIEKHVEPPPSIKSPEDSSPSDKDGNRSKVEEEIARFQKQIEINRSERTRVKTWELRKSNSHRLGSMDSLLSMDSDYSSGRSAPPLPPKGKYVSNDSLVPPHLPPKTKIHHNHHHHQGLKKKQVSISTSEVFIHSDSCKRSDSDDLTSSTVSSVKSMTTPDREFLHDTESLGGSNDSLATLPSVKELATKFQPKPTPPKVEQQPKTGDISKKNKPRALMKLSSQTSKQEIHSLTARSVPQKFREGLKKGMPFMPDRNIKASVESRAPVPNTDEGTVTTNTTATTTTPTSQATLLPVHTKQTTGRNPAHSTQLNIVYDSENKNLVPYPDGDFIRSPSPEHSGIPAVPVTMPMRSKEEEYTSDESYGSLPPSRKHPPMRKKSKNGISSNNK